MKKFFLFLIFPLLVQAETVNHCYDQIKKKSVFTDHPCAKLGLILRSEIDGSKMSRADGLPRTNYVDQNGKFIANRPVGWYDEKPTVITVTDSNSKLKTQEKITFCRKIRIKIDAADRAKNPEAAEYRYQWNKNDCHLLDIQK